MRSRIVNTVYGVLHFWSIGMGDRRSVKSAIMATSESIRLLVDMVIACLG